MRTGLQFLHGGETQQCTAIVDKRFIGYSSLQYTHKRGITLHYNSQRHHLAEPAVWPCNPGPHVFFKPIARSWHHFYVAVTGPLLDEWRADGLWPEQPISIADPEAHAADWRRLHKLMYDHNLWQQQRAINLLEQMLLNILPADANSPEPAWIQAAKNDLAQGYKQESCARKQGMAVSTFRRRFTDSTGICPQDWYVQQRIDRARDRLLNTDMPIASIAAELHYADAPHFARQFKQRVGLSPRDYRNSRNSP